MTNIQRLDDARQQPPWLYVNKLKLSPVVQIISTTLRKSYFIKGSSLLDQSLVSSVIGPINVMIRRANCTTRGTAISEEAQDICSDMHEKISRRVIEIKL